MTPNPTTTMAPKTDSAMSVVPTELIALLAQSYKEDLKTVNAYKIFPEIKMQHGVKKPKFEIGDSDERDIITGVILRVISLKELYRTGSPIPECTSLGGIETVEGRVHAGSF